MKMLHDDLLLTEERDLKHSSVIYTPAPNKQDSTILFYRVHAVGDEAKEVKVGDLIAVAWAKTVPHFLVDNQKYTLTSEKEVLFIVYD